MREIKFRGIAKEKNRFCFGSLIKEYNGNVLIAEQINNYDYDWRSVITDTVGQFTGLSDNNGIKIYEGDIVVVEGLQVCSIEYHMSCFVLRSKNANLNMKDIIMYLDVIEVIDNIHQNPKLLK